MALTQMRLCPTERLSCLGSAAYKLPLVQAHLHSCSSHLVHFYQDEGAVRRKVAAFLSLALRSGGPAIVIAKPRLAQQLRIELHRQHVQGIPFGAERGELVVLDAEETLNAFCGTGEPDAGRFDAVVGSLVANLAKQGKGVAAYGEMVALLCERGNYTGALQLEKLWNELLARHKVALYCAYPSRLFAAPAAEKFYAGVAAAHSEVLDERAAMAN
jgi:hypothetical protein